MRHGIQEMLDYGFRPRLMNFHGGADINPTLYGEKNSGLSGVSEGHDVHDLTNYQIAIEQNRICVGICRGAQFLWAMSGGKLKQHINKSHESPHGLKGLDFLVNSFHHQGIVLDDEGKPPEGLTVLATHQGVVEAFSGMNKDGVQVFAVQWHPEMLDIRNDAASWFYNIVDKLLEQANKE